MKNKNGKLAKVRRDKLKKKLGEKCVYCNCENKLFLTIDHIIPLSRGGKDEDKNKQICCYNCNQLKGALTNEEFKKYLKALNILKDLGKLILKNETPSIKINTAGYPLNEEHIKNEIKKYQDVNLEVKNE